MDCYPTQSNYSGSLYEIHIFNFKNVQKNQYHLIFDCIMLSLLRNLFTAKDSCDSFDTFWEKIELDSELKNLLLENSFILCCPDLRSIKEHFNKNDLLNHIIIPQQVEGEFKSANGKLLSLFGTSFLLGHGFKNEGSSIRIIESFSKKKEGKIIEGYYIHNQFEGGIIVPEEYEEIGSSLVFKYLAVIKTTPDVERLFQKIDKYSYDMIKIGDLTLNKGYSEIKPTIDLSINRNLIVFHSELIVLMEKVKPRRVLFSDIQLSQLLETYVFKKIIKNIYPWLENELLEQNHSFLHKIELLSNISKEDIGIMPIFRTIDFSSVVNYLETIRNACSPIDKLLIMKRCITLIHEEVNRYCLHSSQENAGDIEFATDDLISILILVFILCTKRYKNLYIDIYFCKRFHYFHLPTSSLVITMCHFEVALNWIINYQLSSS